MGIKMKKIYIIFLIIIFSVSIFSYARYNLIILSTKYRIDSSSLLKNNVFSKKNRFKEIYNNQISLILKTVKTNIKPKTKNDSKNSTVLEEKILLKKLPLITLKDIEKEPLKYKDKIVKLKGYAWSWFSRKIPIEIKKLSKLPLAKGNGAITRSDGNFSDGTAIAFLPSPPKKPGKYILYAKISIKDKEWIIKPVYYKKIS